MRKHLYFHSSNMDQIKELRDDPAFEHPAEYPPIPDRLNQHQYEFGRIKTAKNYYHFIFGGVPQEGCPWCSGPCELIEAMHVNPVSPRKFVIQCMRCGARGPIMNVAEIEVKDESSFDMVKDIMWTRFKVRRSWDSGFVNRYEQVTS